MSDDLFVGAAEAGQNPLKLLYRLALQTPPQIIRKRTAILIQQPIGVLRQQGYRCKACAIFKS